MHRKMYIYYKQQYIRSYHCIYVAYIVDMIVYKQKLIILLLSLIDCFIYICDKACKNQTYIFGHLSMVLDVIVNTLH